MPLSRVEKLRYDSGMARFFNGKVSDAPAECRLERAFELLELQKELHKAGEAAENPELGDEELEVRFWRKMRARKERQWFLTKLSSE